MPLTLTLSEGVLPAGTEKKAFSRLCKCMLKWHGLTGNNAIIPNITGSIRIMPKNPSYPETAETSAIWVEWKVPSYVFDSLEIQQGYSTEATGMLYDMAGGKLSKDRIWINVVHAVDGAWNFNCKAMTNEKPGNAFVAC